MNTNLIVFNKQGEAVLKDFYPAEDDKVIYVNAP